MSHEDHFQRLARLLDVEARAESRQALERVQRLSRAEAEATGNCLAALVVREEVSGLGGRCIADPGQAQRRPAAAVDAPRRRLAGAAVRARAPGPATGGAASSASAASARLRVAFNDAARR